MKPQVVLLLLAVGGCGVCVGLTREFMFNNSMLDWFDAQEQCRRTHRDLATVNSALENQQLLQSGGSAPGSWTGLHRSSDLTWIWSDGEPISFPNWFGDLEFSETSNCPIMSPKGEFIPNQNCSLKRTFYCYRFLILVKEKKRWEEAEEFCRTNYTGLASVTSESSLSQVRLETAGTETESVWTGLRFMDGQWLWVNKEQLGRLVSMPSCPVHPYRCGALNTTTNSFQNQNCDEKLNFVCYLK